MFDLLGRGVCVCVPRALEGGARKLYIKFVFSKINGQLGYREG